MSPAQTYGRKEKAPAQKKAAGGSKRSRKRSRSGLRRWLWRAGFLAGGLVILLLSWAVVARGWAPTANTDRTHFDAILVLGYPADADGNPTPTQLARVTEAVHEYERGVAPVLILSGAAAHNGSVEAEVMARTARALGVPESAIIREDRALDTLQNFCYSVRLMQQHGWKSAEIVSSPSHLPRAAMIAQDLPIEWRTHAAPALVPSTVTRFRLDEAVEDLKTVRFLTWARLNERCEP